MSSFKPIDGSKEEFRKYLDRKGVLDAITKVLIKCNSDRPENAIEFLLENLGEKVKDKHTIACLESDLADARNEIETLKRKVESLQIATQSAPGAGIVNGPPADAVTSDSADAANKEANVVSAPETASTQEQPAADAASTENGDSTTAETSEPVPKDQAAQ